jgi:thymidylate kinase
MLLEIEGTAHTGKTTLTNALRKAPWVYDAKKHNWFDTDQVIRLRNHFVPLAVDGWVHISDRGHASEWVYANLYNRRVSYTATEFWRLDMELGKAGTRIIYLSQPHEILRARYKETGRRPEGDLDELDGLWEQFLLDTYCKVLRVDHRFTTEEIVKSIQRYVIEEDD